MVTTTKFTRADYMALPEGYPAELIDGMLVKSPSPTWAHQRSVSEIHVALHGLVGGPRVVVSPIDFPVDEHNVLQPDVLVTRRPVPRDAADPGVPLLVVEVLSPSTAKRDRVQKTAIYLAAGVEEVWLVDPSTESVEVHTDRGIRKARRAETARSEVVPGFEIVPSRLLEDPPG